MSLLRPLLFLALVLMVFEGLSSSAGKWSELKEYTIGELKVEAPLAMVNGFVPVPTTSDVAGKRNLVSSEQEDVRDLVSLSLKIGNYKNIDFGVSKDVICRNMRAGWAKKLCSDPSIPYLRNLPWEVTLHSRVYKERLKSYFTLTSESVFEHFSDMNFEEGPLQVACDRSYLEGIGGRKRTCSAILQITPKVFARWSYGFVRASEDEIETTLNNTCRHGIALHKWLSQDIGIVPIYGTTNPQCPSQLSLRNQAN